MPYIAQERRPRFDKFFEGIHIDLDNKGDLEYCITVLMHAFMHTRDSKYTNLHDTVYAAVHAGHEFERLHLDEREDAAKFANGDVGYASTI